MKTLLLISLLYSSPCWAESVKTKDPIVRVKPSEFKKVPASVIKKLEEMHCLIPQATSFPPLPNNLVSGHFATATSKDWAAYCSINGRSSIRIIWEKSSPCPSTINEGMDKDHIGDMGDHQHPKLEFSRLLSVANKEYILKHQADYGGDLPKVLDHEGVEDGEVEKASVILYCHQGKWMDLQGAD